MYEIYLPTLHAFSMDNCFTGSCGNFRFRIVPKVIMASKKEVDFAQSCITAQFWHGPFCFEKSEIEAENTFPMSEEGRTALLDWLQENV